MRDIDEQECMACRAGENKLTDQECRLLNKQLPDWSIIVHNNTNQLERVFEFKNFKLAIEFTNKIAAIAEEQAHHPALLTEWGKVTVTWWTHKINGLHKNDFICAAKTDKINS